MCSEGPVWSEGTSCCERYLEAGDFLDGDFSELKDGIYRVLEPRVRVPWHACPTLGLALWLHPYRH